MKYSCGFNFLCLFVVHVTKWISVNCGKTYNYEKKGGENENKSSKQFQDHAQADWPNI